MMSEALAVNTSLTIIYLDRNNIGAEGAAALAQVHGQMSIRIKLETVSASSHALAATLCP